MSRDVTFHEEATFRKSKELQLETKNEATSPSAESSGSGSQRERNQDHPMDHELSLEPTEVLEKSLEEAPVKRKPSWSREILQEAEKIADPKGTFRESKRPRRYGGYVALVNNLSESEPSTIDEENKLQVGKDAMLEEYKSIMKNNVWDIVPSPTNKLVVSSKWIYKIKHAANGSIEKFEARFVDRGFTQKEGIDYDETFVPVARYTSIRTIISLASIFGWKLHQMDVKTAFLNGNVEREVYVEQLESLILHSKDSHVCRLRKALYNLKQAPRVWYETMDNFLKGLGFQSSDVDSNLYLRMIKNQPLFVVLYVDDLFLTGENHLIEWCKKELTERFEMKDLGLMHYFLGLEVWQNKDGIFLAQRKYTMDILKRFGMFECKSMATPMITNLKKLHDSDTRSDLVDPTMYRQLIGSLLYLAHTWPDICYLVSALI